MIGAILAVAGSVMSGVQAFQANKKQKQAESSAKLLAIQAKNLKLTNAYEALKVADAGERLAMEYGAAADVSQLEALKASPEGAVGGVAGVAREGTLRDLEIGAALSEKEMETDRLRAEGRRLTNTENYLGQKEMLNAQIMGAQAAAADASASKNAAITNIVTAAGNAVKESDSSEDDYNKDQRKANRDQRKENRKQKKYLGDYNKNSGLNDQAGIFESENIDDPSQLGGLFS
jgi:hypothetical protein